MMMPLRLLPETALADGTISDAIVLELRRQVWASGAISPEDADEILAINARLAEPGAAWRAFYLEALVAFMLAGSNPRGHLTEDQADWLILALDRNGRIERAIDLELLVHLIERMDGTPQRMKTYVLAQIERAVVFGTGPTRADADPAGGSVSASECALLRRVIFAPGGSGPARVSVEEAEMLFRIKDATLGADNAPEWQTLFVQGVANYLQGWLGLSGPSAAQEAAHARFLASRNPGIGGFLQQVVRTAPNGLLSATRPGLFGRRAPARDVVAEARADFAVTPQEQQWLDRQIAADGTTDALEAALIAFLREAAD